MAKTTGTCDCKGMACIGCGLDLTRGRHSCAPGLRLGRVLCKQALGCSLGRIQAAMYPSRACPIPPKGLRFGNFIGLRGLSSLQSIAPARRSGSPLYAASASIPRRTDPSHSSTEATLQERAKGDCSVVLRSSTTFLRRREHACVPCCRSVAERIVPSPRPRARLGRVASRDRRPTLLDHVHAGNAWSLPKAHLAEERP